MRRAVIALGLLLAATAANAQPRIDRSSLAAGRGAVPESWVLVFEDGNGGEAALGRLRERGHGQARALRMTPRLVLLRGAREAAVEGLLDLPGLQAVHPDARVELSLLESVPQVRADGSSLSVSGFGDLDGEGVRACVVDSGIHAGHEAFGGRVDTDAGWNTAGGNADTSDTEGHGTHVASILAGSWPDGRRGLAPGATIVPVRACDPDRSCPISAVVSGIDHCADPDGGNADLVNLSLGGISYSNACDFDPLAIAANAAADAGLLVVAASGNDGNDDAIDTPACGSRVLSVGSVYDSRSLTPCGDPFSEVDERACSSNAGPELDLCAPGAFITAAGRLADDQLVVLQGTSMATPHVSGLAALLLQHSPELSAGQLRGVLKDTAVDLGPAGRDDEFGHGRVDAVAALQSLSACTDCSDPEWGDLHPAAGDGAVELADWLVLRRLALGSAEPGETELSRGDLSPATITCLAPEGASSWCPLGNEILDLADVAALRRHLAGLTSLSCAPCPSGGAAAAVAGGELRRPGDVAPSGGGDGLLDVADVLRLLRFAVGLEQPDEEELLRGDLAPPVDGGSVQVVGGDGALDVADLLLALNASVGLTEIAWPLRDFELSAGWRGSGGVAAVQVELAGWPDWAIPVDAGPDCGSGGGLDALGSTWTVTCAWDPLELSDGSVLATPSYRAPEPVGLGSLALDGLGLDGRLESVDFRSFTLVP